MRTPAELEAAHAALLAPLELPDNWTQAERDAYEGRRSSLDGYIRTARTSLEILAEWQPRRDADIAYKNALADIREQLCQELIALAKPKTDQEFGAQVNVRLSILCVDRGKGVAEGTGWSLATLRLGHLLAERNIAWVDALPEVEHRIAEAKRRCDDAESRLAIALLDDEERAKRDADARARAAAFNALPKAERKRLHNLAHGYKVDERGVAVVGLKHE